MIWIDIAIILIVGLSVFLGYRKGFLRKILGFTGLIVGFIVAVQFYQPIGEFISRIFSSASVIIYLITFLSIIGIVFGLAVWLARYLSNINAGTTLIDKIAGIVIGFLQGLLITSILLVNLSYMDFPSEIDKKNSIFYKSVYNVAPALFNKILSYSPNLKALYEEYKNRFKL